MPVAAPAVAANASLVAIPATISANSDGNLGSTSSVTENLREKGQGGEARLNSTGEGNGSATPSSKNSKSEGLAASLSVVALLLLVIIILIAKRLQKQISRKKLDAALRARYSSTSSRVPHFFFGLRTVFFWGLFWKRLALNAINYSLLCLRFLKLFPFFFPRALGC